MADFRESHGIYKTGDYGIFVKEDLISTSCFQITVGEMYPKACAKKLIYRKSVNISFFIFFPFCISVVIDCNLEGYK